MIKSTFLKKGLAYAGELALLNLIDLEKVLKWNVENNIIIYRMSSSLFPWMSEYQFTDLPNWKEIQMQLKIVGNFVKKNHLRVSFHPGQFNQLGTLSADVKSSTITDLMQHANILEYMGLEGFNYPINIHIGGTYGDKESALKRAIDFWKFLPNKVKSRLILENDDRASGYHIDDLIKFNEMNGTPICFDFHHHMCAIPQYDVFEATKQAYSTWGQFGVRPLTHYSSSKKIEDPTALCRAHADFIYERIETFGNVDVEIEAKGKDLALLKYRQQFLS